jgi:hypothetical protein
MTEPMPEPDSSEQAPEALRNSESPQDSDSTFDPAYIAELRQEAAEGRVKAKRADALARQAVNAIVQGDGRLIDADDLAFDAQFLNDDGLVDAERITAAIDSLVERKPHLAARRPSSPITQGAQPMAGQVSLLDLLQGRP